MVGALLTALASGAIISKGFHKLPKWLICAGVAVALLVTIGLTAENRAAKDTAYVPDIEDIKSINLEGNYGHLKVVFTSDFELLTELHSHMIDVYMETGRHYADVWYSDLVRPDIYITYTLKSGKTVQRSYWVDDSAGLQLLLDIMQTDAYAKSLTMEVRGETELYGYDYRTEEIAAVILTEEETRLLLSTYARELQQASDDVLWEDSSVNVQLRSGEAYLDLDIPQSFAETLTLLKSLVITVIE